MSKTWKLVDYFDVWFNEDEGYFVNNLATVLEGITIAEDASNRDIFDYLKDTVGYFGPEAKFEDMNFEGDDFFIEITSEDDKGYIMPLCRLEREA